MKKEIKEITIFSMLGAMMYASKVLMEILPNIHLIGMFIVAETIVYRHKALYPIYVFVFLTGLISGFATWWIPYLYIWTILWGFAMLIPKSLSGRKAVMIYMIICSLHGFLFGILYAPAEALLFHLDFKAMLAWIAAGLPYDCIHGLSNLATGLLIAPLVKLLKKLENEKAVI